jgi:hypothetical protein
MWLLPRETIIVRIESARHVGTVLNITGGDSSEEFSFQQSEQTTYVVLHVCVSDGDEPLSGQSDQIKTRRYLIEETRMSCKQRDKVRTMLYSGS